MTQPPDDHLKALWQGQDTETPTMAATAIRALARNYGDNIRGRIWIGLAIGAFEVVVFGLQALRAQNEVLRTGWLIILAGIGWVTWRILSKRPGRLPPPETSAQALIDFHRAELEHQRTNFRWMIVTAAPMFLGMAVTLFGVRMARPNMHAGEYRAGPDPDRRLVRRGVPAEPPASKAASRTDRGDGGSAPRLGLADDESGDTRCGRS